MGIYDREYFRRDRSGMWSIFGGAGHVYMAIIVATVVAFLIQVATRTTDSFFGAPIPNSGPFTEWLAFSADAVMHGQIWRLLTYAFLHATNDIWHILFNMLIFWFVGREVEDIYGPREFLAFYLVAALFGGLFQLAADLLHITAGGMMIGASGAVTAVLVLYAMHFPTRIFYLFFFIPVPALVLVVVYVLFDALGLLSGAPGGVAVACHLGGAAFGFIYFKLNWRLLRFWPQLPDWKSMTQRRPRLRVYRESDEEPVAVHAPNAPQPDSQLEAEVDTVLEKVSRLGKSSLTERERQILVRASEMYRNKRK